MQGKQSALRLLWKRKRTNLSQQISFSIYFPTKANSKKAKCRQFNRFQSFVQSFPSFGRGFDSVTIFVRHSAACKYKGEEFCRRCNCRKHLRWTAGGVQYRRSAKARTWVEAERQKQYLIEQMSAGNAPATPTVALTIHSLVEAFVTSKQSQ